MEAALPVAKEGFSLHMQRCFPVLGDALKRGFVFSAHAEMFLEPLLLHG